jgi:hypothetical protein
MAKRARGALPTVEPKSSPRFAPSPGQFSGREVAATGVHEILDETETSLSVGAQQGGKRWPSAKTQRELRDESFDAFSIRESAHHSPSIHAPKPDALQPESSEVSRLSSTLPETTGSPFDSKEEIASTKQPPGIRHKTGGIEADRPPEILQFSTPASVEAMMYQQPGSRPRTSELIGRVVDDEAAGNDEITERSQVSASDLTQYNHDRRLGTRTDAAEATSTSSAEQKTEIHISIGRIEFSTERVEARTQSVPFRPRVTLSDFLGRNSRSGA